MASNTPRPTKAERREAARAKAQALRLEQEKRERRAKVTRRVGAPHGTSQVMSTSSEIATNRTTPERW